MSVYLITQSLLSAWGYMFDCFEGQEDSAKEEFINTLKRKRQETTEAMQNGIDFENEVYKAAAKLPRKSHDEWEDGIQKVSAIVAGAPFQVKAQRKISVENMDFLVYGILDAVKAGTIYDVKFLNKSFTSVDLAGKYLNSPQHPAYFYIVPEATEFRYLVSDGSDVYIECYQRENTSFIGEIIAEFIDSLESMGLMETYKEMWRAK